MSEVEETVYVPAGKRVSNCLILDDRNVFHHYCPGCKSYHGVPVNHPGVVGNGWDFNGDVFFPSLSPSLKHSGYTREGNPVGCCHYFIKNGIVEYLSDCTHDYKNQKIALPDVPPTA